MNQLMHGVQAWLTDYIVASTLVLLVTFVALIWIRQPILRIVLCRSAIVGLLGLAAGTACPLWSKFSLQPVRGVASADIPRTVPRGVTPYHPETTTATASTQAQRVEPSDSQPLSQHGSPIRKTRKRQIAIKDRIDWTLEPMAAMTYAYLTGMGFVSVWLASGCIRVCWLCRTSRPAPPELLSQLNSLLNPDEVAPRVLVNGSPNLAAAVGPIAPTILIPLHLTLSRETVHAILAHELAHIRNKDLLFLTLSRILLVFLYAHPLYWWLRRVTRDVEEVLADAGATKSLSKQEYAEGLLNWARNCVGAARNNHPSFGLGIWGKKSQLSRRLSVLLNDELEIRLSCSRLYRSIVAGLGGVLVILSSLVTLTPARPVFAIATSEDLPEQTGLLEGGTVTGRIVDGEGKTVAGASVWIVHDARRKIDSTSCDEDGRFRFNDVAAGRITVVGWSNGHSFAAANYPLQEGQPLRDITLTLGAPGELHLRISDKENRVIRRAMLAALGVATGDTTAVWPPIEVLKRINDSDLTSDADGHLRINGIPESGICEGSIRHPDYAKQGFSDATAGQASTSIQMEPGYPISIVAINGATGEPAREATVTIKGQPWTVNLYDEPVDENGELTIRLPRAESVFIRVRHPQLIAPRVEYIRSFPGKSSFTAVLQPRVSLPVIALDQHGAPAPGVQIGLLSRREGAVVAKWVTNTSGRVTIDVAKGHNTLEVRAGRGYAASDERTMTFNTEEIKSATLHVKRLPSVNGRVLLPTGEPAANALVLDATMSRSSPLLTDQNGRFEYTFFWRRNVTHARATASHLIEPLSGGGARSVEELERGQELIIPLASESEIYGNAVSPDGTPVAGAQLWLQSSWTFGNWRRLSIYGSTVTNEAGDYRFPGLSHHMRYRVLKAPPGGATAVRFVDLTTDIVRKNKVIRSAYRGQKSEERTLGQEAPELSCQGWVNSLPLDLNALRGKVVLLDFWAIWCGPCIAELPQVQMAHDVFSDKGAVVIGLHDNSRSPEEVARFAEQNGLTFPIGVDTTSGQTHGRYNITGWPTKILIDRSGRVVAAGTSSNWLSTLRALVLHGEQ